MAKNDANKINEWVIDQLKLRRKELGISHEKLAAKIKLSRSAIGLIESKKRNPTLLTALKICEALEISLGKLLLRYKKLVN